MRAVSTGVRRFAWTALRNQPEIFRRTLRIRRSRSASLLVGANLRPLASPAAENREAAREGGDPEKSRIRPPPRDSRFKEFHGAIMAKIVEKCGPRRYWNEWAGDVARIALAHVERSAPMVTVDERNEGNADIKAAAEVFDDFVTELRGDLNPGVSRADAIEILARHMVTGPVFDALFGQEAFAARNPVSRAMQDTLDDIKSSGIGAAEARQRIIAELYDKFFRNAFPEPRAIAFENYGFLFFENDAFRQKKQL